jgi:hypothetical protein
LPQELRVNRITDYPAANRYLEEVFIRDFNRRFTVKPAQPESAFVKLAGIEVKLVLSAREERIVRNNNTVGFHNLILQLPPSRYRAHFVRCPVTVHQFSDGKLGVSYQGRLLARYDRGGSCCTPPPPPIGYAPPVCSRQPSQLMLSPRLQTIGARDPGSHIFPPAPRKRVRARAKKCLSVRPPAIPLPEVIRRVLPLRFDLFPAD